MMVCRVHERGESGTRGWVIISVKRRYCKEREGEGVEKMSIA